MAVYDRATDGSLALNGYYTTGGLGTGSGLGSQGALVLSADNQWLFAVNAGSDQVSSLAVYPDHLELADVVSSGGSHPISVTTYGNLLYVLNTGAGGNITGFWIGSDGSLTPIPGSTRPLSNKQIGDPASPEQIGFSADGQKLVVTEKDSGLILVYPVNNGVAHGPILQSSSGPAPYAFAFTPSNVLVVSEAANSTLSAYSVDRKGLSLLSASVPDFGGAACWLVVTKDGRFTYTANAATSTISGYAIAADGSLSLLDVDGVTGFTGDGSKPLDMALNADDAFLYVVSANTNTISAFAVNSDGSLSFLAFTDVMNGMVGLAAW